MHKKNHWPATVREASTDGCASNSNDYLCCSNGDHEKNPFYLSVNLFIPAADRFLPDGELVMINSD